MKAVTAADGSSDGGEMERTTVLRMPETTPDPGADPDGAPAGVSSPADPRAAVGTEPARTSEADPEVSADREPDEGAGTRPEPGSGDLRDGARETDPDSEGTGEESGAGTDAEAAPDAEASPDDATDADPAEDAEADTGAAPDEEPAVTDADEGADDRSAPEAEAHTTSDTDTEDGDPAGLGAEARTTADADEETGDRADSDAGAAPDDEERVAAEAPPALREATPDAEAALRPDRDAEPATGGPSAAEGLRGDPDTGPGVKTAPGEVKGLLGDPVAGPGRGTAPDAEEQAAAGAAPRALREATASTGPGVEVAPGPAEGLRGGPGVGAGVRGLDGAGGGAAPGAGAAVPPLELLASLTNTAPPPETPRRTIVRRVKVWTPLLLLLGGACVGAQLLRPLPAPVFVAAESVHALDGQFTVPWPAKGQGAIRVVGSGDISTFGEQKPVPTASVAKVMTAYVILKGHPLRNKDDAGPSVEVDAKAVAEGNSESESRAEGLTAGTKFSQQDMLKMLMIPSANNVARLLARWDTGSGDETAFVAKMNAAAGELGMKNTTYTDPSGLDAGTVSTAVDQLKLAEAVMKDEAFRAVVALPDATIKGLPKPIYNNNGNLLTASGLSIKGIKTGSSTPAGGTLMWAAYKTVGDETPRILGTMMDQHVDGPDPDGANSLVLVKENSRKVIEAVRGALASTPAVRKGQQVGYVDDGLGGRTPLVATKDLNVIGVPGQRMRISLTAGASGTVRTAKDGTEVGVLTVGDGDGAKSVPVAVRGDLAEPSVGTRLTRLR
ncbi:D-alanyl-D-alanine carboxypeptidase [Streptomyces sp. NPDC059072]|uniref:D-alanyl-D-alanine carboxypeptidase n=1 Tax=Streptomyces sp. NPDC059072 TaxID=3346715 RepID=UPI00369E5D00